MPPDSLPTIAKSGTFTLLGVELRVHVLSDGRRLIEKESLEELFEAMANPIYKFDETELNQYLKWTKGLTDLTD